MKIFRFREVASVRRVRIEHDFVFWQHSVIIHSGHFFVPVAGNSNLAAPGFVQTREHGCGNGLHVRAEFPNGLGVFQRQRLSGHFLPGQTSRGVNPRIKFKNKKCIGPKVA